MAAVTTKRPKASAVKQASIKDTNAFLQSLPEKPKEDLSLREAVEQMRDSVRGALAKGYTYQELAAMLTEKGIRISAFTLKNYVPSGRRRSTKEQVDKVAPKRGRKSKAEVGEIAVASLEASKEPSGTHSKNGTAPVAASKEKAPKAPAKAPRGRGKATTAAKAKSGSEAEATVKQPATRRRRSTTVATADSKPTTTRGRKKAGA
ncbi:MAG: hypothetical protein NW224_27245 [Leptolyngbyaceae cyanobacterium bins.302]|nr:hypothetical protein [Leptolyngbyaceae cyanobacterium bins.302]